MEGCSWVLLLLVLNQGVDSFPFGPPAGRCSDGYPHHGPQDQFGRFTGMWSSKPLAENPYEITTSSSTYTSGQVITVTIKGNAQNVDKPFKGFLVRAKRTSGDTDELLGAFSGLPADAMGITYSVAFPGPTPVPNCVSHNNNTDKTVITLTWTAPASNIGEIILGGTVVSQTNTFYVGVTTKLTPWGFPAGDPNIGPVYMPKSAVTVTDMNYTGCGTEFGCMKSPGDCGSVDCNFVLSWRPDPDNANNVYYELGSKIPTHDTGFIALGWSTDKSMGDDDTVSCTYDGNGNANIQYGVNAPSGAARYNDRRRTEGFSKLAVKRVDGVLFCSFSRPAELTTYYYDFSDTVAKLGTVTINQKTTDYHLLVAVGAAYSYQAPNKHDAPPKVSENKWNFWTNKDWQSYTGETITNFNTTIPKTSSGSNVIALVTVTFMGLIVAFFAN